MAEEEAREDIEERPPDGAGDSASVDPGAETVEHPAGSEPRPPSGAPSSADGEEDSRRRRGAPLRCQEFGDYRIVEEVARGAMGIVYRAEQRRLGREVALKVMLTGEHASEGEVRRFTREAQALARLKHPNIVPIYDIGEVDGRHYFTMDFVEGQTLSQVLSERELTVTEGLHIIEQVADAVAAAHTRGVVHRDIKPSNIMLDSDGGVHIMDFGLAKAAGAETKHTRDGTTIGTPSYMPPEQARGEVSRVDERSDVYSMGAVLYEVLTGRSPFAGTNLLEIVLAVINEDPPRPRSVNSRVPRELETIILKCMEKDPARRYHTAGELRDEIRRFRSGEPIHAQPPSHFYRLRKRLRKHWVLLSMTAAVLLIAAAATGAVIFILKYDPPPNITEAKWQTVDSCDFSPEAMGRFWTTAVSFHDFYLSPVSSEQKDRWTAGRVLISQKLVHGSARTVFTFALKERLGADPLVLGFYSSAANVIGRERVPCLFRVSGERVQLLANVAPDSSGTSRVVADGPLPRLRPGPIYRVTAERHGITLRFSLEEEDTAGEFSEIARLSYAHPQLSNYRYMNLNVMLRGGEKLVRPQTLTIERLFFPRETSALVSADSLFFRGEYNGAFDEYSMIAIPREGARQSPLDRASANYRLGLYWEIKKEPERAISHYEQARMLAAELPDDEGLRAVAEEALLRELAVYARKGPPQRVYRLLQDLEAVSEETLAGPWVWDLVDATAHVADRKAGLGQPDLAVQVAARLKPPNGSAVLGLRLERIASACTRGDLEELIAFWLPRLGPTPAPILQWAHLCARAGKADRCVELFRRSAEVLKPGNRELTFSAAQACRAFASRFEFSGVSRVIAASGYRGLEGIYLEALDSAISRNNPQALELLRFAKLPCSREDLWGKGELTTGRIADRAVQLADRYWREGRQDDLGDIDDAFPTPKLAAAYARAIVALRSTEAPIGKSLGLLQEASRRFGTRNDMLAELAAGIGATYAGCANKDDHRMVRDAHAAYPSRKHLANFRKALNCLLDTASYESAGEVFAYARARLGPDAAMADAVRRMLEMHPPREDVGRFMEQLAGVERSLAARPLQQKTWYLELARYHLLADNDLAAAETYKLIYDAKARTEREKKLVAEALLRRGLLAALLEGVGHRQAAEKALGRLRKAVGGNGSRASVIAGAVLDRELDEQEFKSNARKAKISTAEMELVLAANASYTERHLAKAQHLRMAWESVIRGGKGFGWPYELIKFNQEAAMKGPL
ncbi:MAG: serine/threonine-protein kinase [Planctomycetota bacterium]